jgi:regulator of replication initiation timing
MDNETILSQLNTIEKRVEDLIAECKRLDSENNELKRQNESLSLQLDEKITIEKQNDDVKQVIRSKIDSLMGKLDEFSQG